MPHEPVHFLMVDDLEDNLIALEALLRRDGLVLHRARSGAEALEMMLSQDYALALLDVQMPGMDGYELAELMRGIERTRKIPIVFLTAAALDERRMFRGYEAGAVDYISKPIDPMILQSKAQVFFEIGLQAKELARQRDEMRAVSQNLAAAVARIKSHTDNSPLGVVEFDDMLTIRHWSKGAERMFGLTARDMEGQRASTGDWLTAESVAELNAWFDAIRHEGGAGRNTLLLQARTVSGRQIDCECYGSVIPPGHGALQTMNLQILDVTERRRSEEMRSVLIGELNHRVKNTLANVQAIARQTARHTTDPAHFIETFNGRLSALAKAHSILSSETWSGADLTDLIAEEIRMGALPEDRVSREGPMVRLAPAHALQLALTLHELTTNAVKYGALSVPTGHISLTWTLAADELTFHWRETGGPEVVAPARSGFGSVLITSGVGAEGGEAVADWRPEGVCWTIRMMVDPCNDPHEAEPANSRPSYDKASDPAAFKEPREVSLGKRRVLVIEDEVLLSMEVAAAIREAGATVAGTAFRLREALDLIARAPADLAILDGNLHGESVERIAEALRAQGVSFCFTSGYGREHLPDGFDTTPVLEKPFATTSLLATLRELAARQDATERMRISA
ncbi:response regulator [Falsirhodobacter sp. alg1]|uniref:response regulator n=1 Tax=Falsirhodobacter sp. alg1 TaxID=1472418 RepID=UPI000789A7B0|nr:response regulator [Falsirhodobacter sp. alg1]